MSKYLIVFAISALATCLATPLARRLALRVGAIDHPSDRKVHPRATATLGGTAIFFGVLVAMTVARFMPGFSGLYRNSSELWATLVAGSVIFLVGVYPLMMFLWPSGWRWQPNQPEYEQMILGVYATLGVFLTTG